MAKAKTDRTISESPDKPFILNRIRTEYLVGFMAMALIIFAAVAGESLTPSTNTQTREIKAALTAGEGECSYDTCECLAGFPETCLVNHYYSPEIYAKPVTSLLEASRQSARFSLDCGTEHIKLQTRNSPSEPWNAEADDTYISHVKNCPGQ